MKVFVFVGAVVALWALAEAASVQKSYRDEKFLSLFSLVRIANKECIHEDLHGLCYPSTLCGTEGGTSKSTTCGSGHGNCCVFASSACDSTITKKVSYVMDPKKTEGYTKEGKCKYTIDVDDDTCQVRLDFVMFELQDPVAGECNADKLTISGNDGGTFPVMCGSHMLEQHMYIPVDKSDIVLKFYLMGTVASRKWKLRSTKIDCGSSDLAPSGCMQYYTETSHAVQSFNYNTNVGDFNTFVNQQYTVCVKPHSGYSKIKWTLPATKTFEMKATACNVGAVDYVLIPGGATTDRHCNIFPAAVESALMPYHLYVVTSSGASLTRGGFYLEYTLEI